MLLPPSIQHLITGIRNNDLISLMILIGIVAFLMIVVAIIVNAKSARAAKNAPPPQWGTKSARYKK
jgi:hypothetical protein